MQLKKINIHEFKKVIYSDYKKIFPNIFFHAGEQLSQTKK